jgi:hypothetical protein
MDHNTQDPAEEVFIRLECFQCHAVKRERFPEPGKEPSGLGPELTGMGGSSPSGIFRRIHFREFCPSNYETHITY